MLRGRVQRDKVPFTCHGASYPTALLWAVRTRRSGLQIAEGTMIGGEIVGVQYLNPRVVFTINQLRALKRSVIADTGK